MGRFLDTIKPMIFILALLGLAAGSFINALVWRIHKTWNVKAKKQKAKYSMVKGRSMCEHCQHKLAWHDLLPLVSWLLLKGRCRYCQKPIGYQPLALELVMPVVFVGSYAFWPLGFDLVDTTLLGIWLICLVILAALAVYDQKYMLLPDKLVYPLIALSLTFVVVRLIHPCENPLSFTGVALSVLIAGGLFLALNILSKGKLIGMGDGKLGIALGLLLGKPELAVLMLFVASLLGTAVALPTHLAANKSKKIPFGPHLIVATVICFLFGSRLVDLYFSTIGL